MQGPPDFLGKSVRFGCGALFGALAGAGVVLQMIIGDWHIIAVVAVATALVCGFLAMRWGDDFWSWLASWFDW